MARTKKALRRIGNVDDQILGIRGQKVIIDSGLARLYGVSTKRLNEQVKRNSGRFPEDFMFQLTSDEKLEVVANCDHLARLKFSPNLPYAFTEHGAVMAASVLNTPQAIEMGIFVVRAFVRLRQILAKHKDLARKLNQLEKKLQDHDVQIIEIVNAVKRLMLPETRKKLQIGYLTEARTRKKPKKKKAMKKKAMK